MNLKLIGVALVAIVIAIGGYSFPNVQQSERPLAAVVGPNVQDHMYFNQGSTNGGRVATTSTGEGTAKTYTLNAKDFVGLPTYIDWTPNDDITVSWSATSTFDYVPNIGDVAVVYFRNASTTAGASLAFNAVDSGVDLQTGSTTVNIQGLDWGRFTIIRESTHLTSILFEKYIEAD